jgi:hypothetical protein
MDQLLQTPEGRDVNWEDTLSSSIGGISSLVNAFKGNGGNRTVAAAPALTPPPSNNNIVLWIVLGLAAVLGLGLILKR